MGLNKKQQAFVEHYLQTWNAAEAARRAGYAEKSARQQGSRLMTNADIQDEVQARIKAMQVSTDEALVILARHARGNIRKFAGKNANGDLAFDFDGKTDADWQTIKALEIVPGEFGTRVRVEMYDSQAAITQILKQHALANGKPTENVQFVINGLPDEYNSVSTNSAA